MYSNYVLPLLQPLSYPFDHFTHSTLCPFFFSLKIKKPTKLQETYAKKDLLQKHKTRNQNKKQKTNKTKMPKEI